MQDFQPVQLDKYDVIRRLAVGGMGEIFLARQTGVAGIGRFVIVKTLLPSLVEDETLIAQFLDEARVAATLNHPNIVGILEVGEWEGTYFIAMEYIRGVDLDGLLRQSVKQCVPVPARVAVQIIRDAATGLDAAHHAVDDAGAPLNLVHRDISPHNIMVRQDGVVKVVDFGIARSANRMNRTQDNVVKGRLRYMSPEQIHGLPLDARSDQFGLGVVLWELVARRPLFRGSNVVEVAAQVDLAPIPPLARVVPGTPPALDQIIGRALHRDASARYSRLAEMAQDLASLLGATGGSADLEVRALVKQLAGETIDERTRDTTSSSGQTRAPSGSRCLHCAAPQTPGARFCSSCGARASSSGMPILQFPMQPREEAPATSDAAGVVPPKTVDEPPR